MTDVINPTTGEILTVAATRPLATLNDMLKASGISVVKQVTRTVLQQKDDVPFLVRFESVVRESEVQEGTGRGGKPKMANARVADVLEYELHNGVIVEGSHKILIINTVLEGELNRNYANNAFVGKAFLIRSHFPVDLNSATGRKSYKVYEILEVTVDGGEVEGEKIVADGNDPVNAKGKAKS